MNYIEGEEIKSRDFSENPLERGDYEDCIFSNCNFSNADLSHINFVECELNDCDLSTSKLVNTAFREITFKGCKLLGLHFEHCNDFLFQVRFENCQLDLSTFYQRQLKQTLFKDCSLKETDFTEADLTASVFDNCDLAGAVFENSILEKADLRTAHNFNINPNTNRINKAVFSNNNLSGLLQQYDVVIKP